MKNLSIKYNIDLAFKFIIEILTLTLPPVVSWRIIYFHQTGIA